MFLWTFPTWQRLNKAFIKPLSWNYGETHLVKCAASVHWSVVVIMSSVHPACVYRTQVICEILRNVSVNPPSASNKGKHSVLLYIGWGEDIDVAFWWHYDGSLIVAASNRASSLAQADGAEQLDQADASDLWRWAPLKDKNVHWMLQFVPRD